MSNAINKNTSVGSENVILTLDFNTINQNYREYIRYFIDILLSKKELRVLNQGDSISPLSILEVIDSIRGEVASICMSELMSMATPVGQDVVMNPAHILTSLAAMGIQIDSHDYMVHHDEREISDDEFGEFDFGANSLMKDMPYSVIIAKKGNPGILGRTDIENFAEEGRKTVADAISYTFRDIGVGEHMDITDYFIKIRFEIDLLNSITLVFTGEQIRKVLLGKI